MWCCRFPIYICDIKFLIWLRYWSCFWHDDKCDYCSLHIQFYKLLWLWFYVDFYSNLGCYCNNVEYRHKYHNRQHISIRKTSLFYRISDDLTRRDPVSNVGIESVGSAGQAGFTYQVIKRLCVFCT